MPYNLGLAIVDVTSVIGFHLSDEGSGVKMKRVKSRFPAKVVDGDIDIIRTPTQYASFVEAEERANGVLSKQGTLATPNLPARGLRSGVSLSDIVVNTAGTPYESLRSIAALGPRPSLARHSLQTPNQFMPSSSRKQGVKSAYTPSGLQSNGTGRPPTPHTARALLRKATGVQVAPQSSTRKVRGKISAAARRRETPRNNLRRLAGVLASVEAFDPLPPAPARGQEVQVHDDDITSPIMSANIGGWAVDEDYYIEPSQVSTLTEPKLSTALPSESVSIKADEKISPITGLQKERVSAVAQSTTRSPLQDRPLIINTVPDASEIGLRDNSILLPPPDDIEIFRDYQDNDDVPVHSPLDEDQDLYIGLRSARPSLGGIVTEVSPVDEIMNPEDESKPHNESSAIEYIGIRGISQE